MARVLIAGATGYLGGFLLAEAEKRGHAVRALTRSEAKLSRTRASVADVFVGEVTRPETLHGVAQGVDVVISAIGITRQRDGLSYEEVDYGGNANLLREAVKSGVRKFIYVSVLNPEQMADLKIVQAKERFVRELRSSGLDCTVIRPNGYFSDMLAFLKMARSGRVFLFGRGEFLINPISGRDVATRCLDAIDLDDPELSFGGPSTLTHREIAHEAFDALGTRPRVTCIPVACARALLWLARAFAPARVYGPLEFTLTVTTTDMVGPSSGRDSLKAFFCNAAAHEYA